MNPASRIVQQLLIGVVRIYRLLLSPWLGNQCRFTPTCSAYALEALEQHGPWRGGCLSVRRMIRCGPWCKGGNDPVPPAATDRLFSSLLNPSGAGASVAQAPASPFEAS